MNSITVEKIDFDSVSRKTPNETIIQLFRNLESLDSRIAIVHLPPGLVRDWNKHNTDQLVWVVDGEGILISETKETRLQKGTAVHIPKGVNHRHGATKENSLTQLSIIL